MRISKRYSNATFTKRVDHDAGEHRPPRAAKEPATCKSCGAIYSRRRWVSAEGAKLIKDHKAWRPAMPTVCPACKQLQEGTPRGYVYLAGPYLSAHRADIEQFIHNEAARAGEDNPLARVMERETDEQGQMVLTTTSDHLAKRLGRALERAFGGEVKYSFSHENKLTRVYWQRD